MGLEGSSREAFKTKIKRDRTLHSCYPHPSFPTISITGDSCVLNCKHCSHHYLRGMISCGTPDKLNETFASLASDGTRGVLLSGGDNKEGYVPFEPFLESIGEVKRQTGLFISAHTGLVPKWLGLKMGKAGIDLADFDLIGDDETIELVLGINKKVKDYQRAMMVLNRFLPYVIPHICVGLHAGEIRGELKALDMASKLAPPIIVLLVLNPTSGTKFENLNPPSIKDFEKVAIEARMKFPEVELALGCMRPRGSERQKIELAALRAGFDRIELPSKLTIKTAREMGLRVKNLFSCCAVPSEVIKGW